MTLFSPFQLLWLLPLAGIIITLYLLKMRRRDFRVPATFLWPHATSEVRANSLFQRLRFSWLMLLQLLALSLIVFAVARPQVRSNSFTGEATVIVIDSSASMSATDVAPSRLAEAVRLAEQTVDSAHRGDRVSVIEAGPTPKVLLPLTNDSSRVHRALQSVEPTDAAGDVGEALRLAASLVARENSARIILLSDGVFSDIENFSAGKAEVVFRRIGVSDQNTAITALGVTETLRGSQLYCGLKNYGSAESKGVLNIFADGKLFNAVKVSVPSRSATGASMPAPKGSHVIEARLENGDILSSDNYAVHVNGAGTLSVLLVGKGDLFLEKALALDPRVSLFKSATLPNTGNYDLVVFDGEPEVPVKAVGVLTFGAAGPGTPAKVLGSSQRPVFKGQEGENSLLKGVSFENVFISRTQRVQPDSIAQVLATTDAGPLLVVSRRAQRHVYVAFEPLQSDFPLQVSFPIFVSNALSYLAPQEATSADLGVVAGRTVAFPAMAENIEVKDPYGKSDSVQPVNGQYVLRNLLRVGRYEVATKPQRHLYITLGDAQQSNVAPVDHLLLGSHSVKASDLATRFADWWKPLALLALLVLAGEWWLFIRRS